MRRTLLFLLIVMLFCALPSGHQAISARTDFVPAPTTRTVVRAFNHPPQTNQKEVAEIESSARGLDRYAKVNARQGRYFADLSSYEKNERARWQEFKTSKALDKAWQNGDTYTSANIWTKPTGEMIAVFTFSSPSGDWAQYMTNYYRADGTLAKSSAELRTFMGNIIRIHDRLYDTSGKLLREQTRYLDLKTRRPKRVKKDEFMDVEAPLYTKASGLPFYTLLKKR